MIIRSDELSDREFGFVKPDRSKLIGPAGGRHGALVAEIFPSDVRLHEEHLDSFFKALDLGWVSYSRGSLHLVLHFMDDPGTRELAAGIIQEYRDAMDITVAIHEQGWAARLGRHIAASFGPDERTAIRWVRSSTLPPWAIDVTVIQYEAWGKRAT